MWQRQGARRQKEGRRDKKCVGKKKQQQQREEAVFQPRAVRCVGIRI